MSEISIWNEVIKQGFSMFLMALFTYFTYKYFTRQRTDDLARFDREKKELQERLDKKDVELAESRQQLLELNKLNIESWSNLMGTLGKLATKIDKLT
jgi:predicted negative regulator of RcsB-dependent stress response